MPSPRWLAAQTVPVMIGAALSGITYTALSGYFNAIGSPEYVWYVLAAHTLLGILVLAGFTKIVGEFSEQEQ